MTKLLDKPLKTFIVFTCLVLTASVPVYFYLIESTWIDELDDHNLHQKERIQERLNQSSPEELQKKMLLWNELQYGSRLLPASRFRKDSTYIVEREIVERGEIETERFRGMYSVISVKGKLYSFTIETNVEEVHQGVKDISIITFCFILLLIVGFVMLSRRLSKKIWAPFTDTLEKLKHFDLNSNETILFVDTDIREFTELNNVLGRLIENNVRLYTQQKEFTQNASHELQTPLALLKTKLDLLIQDGSLTSEQRKIIEALDNTVSRVTRINKNLLLLAGIENKHYETANVNVSELVKLQSAHFVDFAEEKGCRILRDIDVGLIIETNESLLEIMITNLLSNAVRHCPPESEIRLSLKDRILTVSNKGTSPLLEAGLFRRFGSANAQNPSSGLGLAIVKEICDKYDWKVSYKYQQEEHLFSVFF